MCVHGDRQFAGVNTCIKLHSNACVDAGAGACKNTAKPVIGNFSLA